MVPLRSSSVPLERLHRVDKLVDEERSDVQSLHLVRNRICKNKYVSFELDTDKGEGMTQKLKFAAKQLNDRIHLHT